MAWLRIIEAKPWVELLQGNLVPWKISDRTNHGNHINVSFNGVLRPEQDAAVKAMIQHDDGILHATTAFGKTVTAAALIASRGVNTLVIVPTRALLNQWKAQMEKFLTFSGDMPEGRTKRGKPRKGFSPVGLIGGAKDTRHGVKVTQRSPKPLMRVRVFLLQQFLISLHPQIQFYGYGTE